MQMNPYLTFDGNCEEAMKAYAQVLRGEIVAMMPFEGTPAAESVAPEWRNKILHAALVFGDNRLMASDGPSSSSDKKQGISVALVTKDPAEAERVFNALAEGGTVTMPFQETFWAHRFGMLVDRFGTPWMINCDRPS